MADGEIACPRCSQPMQEGFLLDTDGDATLIGRGVAGQWVEGPIEHGILGGLKFRSKRQVPITAYRCPECGFLEAYAR